MKNIIFYLISLLFLFSCNSDSYEIKVLQLNIWQEGTMVEGGYEALVEEIARADADFVILSEVRNYNNTRFCDRITASLQEKGQTYYSFYSYDSGLLSKYPIKDSVAIFPENEDHGSIYKLTTEVHGQKMSVYTAHLDYLNCSYYLVRGYCGSTWEKLDGPVTDIDTLLADNVASKRDDAIRLFIEDALTEVQQGSLIFFGGDLNEPSHLDWIEETKDIADHHGVVIPWTVSTLLAENGFKDAYRVKYPDPVEYPGYTYPADCPGAPIEKLTWAPEADERERIDVIYYYPSPKVELEDIAIYGPRGCIINSQRVEEKSRDPFIEPITSWPTDHKGVIATFKIKK